MSVEREEGADWVAPRSSVETIVWPPLPPAEAVRLLALGQQLDESQWWLPERLREHQLRQLQKLLDHGAGSVPFYRERLSKAGIDPKKPVGWDAYTRLPILTRREVQLTGERLRSGRLPKIHGNVVIARTTGATGRPASFARSAVSLAMSEAFSLRGHAWRRENPEGKLALILADRRPGPSSQPSAQSSTALPHWGRPVAVVYPTGPGALLEIGLETARQVDWLQREKPQVLLSTPSNLLALARHCAKSGIKLPSLRTLRSTDEAVTPELRRACQEAWGLRLFDEYVAKETGPIALQCPETDNYHLQSEAMIAEVLDDAGVPCKPGKTGQVVVTPLHNFAMPLIRYALGDYAEVGEPCSCGRGLPVLTGIFGRARGLMTLPSGATRFPLYGSAVFRDVPGVAQFQLVQHAPDRLEVRLVAESDFDRAREAAIRDGIAARLGRDIEVDFAYPAEISRDFGICFEEFQAKFG